MPGATREVQRAMGIICDPRVINSPERCVRFLCEKRGLTSQRQPIQRLKMRSLSARFPQRLASCFIDRHPHLWPLPWRRKVACQPTRPAAPDKYPDGSDTSSLEKARRSGTRQPHASSVLIGLRCPLGACDSAPRSPRRRMETSTPYQS